MRQRRGNLLWPCHIGSPWTGNRCHPGAEKGTFYFVWANEPEMGLGPVFWTEPVADTSRSSHPRRNECPFSPLLRGDFSHQRCDGLDNGDTIARVKIRTAEGIHFQNVKPTFGFADVQNVG
jgi:hypothetical protein